MQKRARTPNAQRDHRSRGTALENRAPRRPAPREQSDQHGAEVDGVSSLILPATLEESLSHGHPWIYRDHVRAGVLLPSGTWVRVRAGKFTAFAVWDATSPIALRVFARERAPDAAWFRERVKDALALRRRLLGPDSNAFRLLYGEGDGVPGVTVDVYDRFAVVVTYATALEALLPQIVAAIDAELSLDGIVRKTRRDGSSQERLEVLSGKAPPERLIVTENGIRFLAELGTGQKTGLFLDHRENRAFIRTISNGREVLNLFAYTGAFSLYAALGGASRVRSVDAAPGAIAAARENFELNELDPSAHEFAVADVFSELEALASAGRKFDLVISDPPSFPASRDKLHGALRAYVRLHALGLRVLRRGGLYAAASCTAQVSPDAFRRVLAEAAARSRVRFQIIHEAGQALDHPYFAGHPEGRYLKFVVGRVL